MLIDKFGTAHTSEAPAAVAAFEDAVLAVAAHRPIGKALQMALEHDKSFVAAHALTGLANVILGRGESLAHAKTLLPATEAALAARGNGTPAERALVDALRLAAAGHMQAAATRLETHVYKNPHDFLAIKVSHALRFMSGQPDTMVALTGRVVSEWTPDHRAYGFLLGCHSFGLEECGQYAAAEQAGREACRYEPADAWGLHAVSHVMEMEHRITEGVEWLNDSRPDWGFCNNFAFHLAWHLALFLLEQGRIDEVLELYDREIRPTPTDDFRDVANASSLLWRVEREGFSVGTRWVELHEIAVRRSRDATYIFASLHYLLALVASRDYANAEALLKEFRAVAADPQSDQARIAADVGIPLAEIIIAMSRGERPSADLVRAANRLQTIGGSHAQRDVFLRTLLETAANCGDSGLFSRLSRIRHSLRSADRFVIALEKRLSDCGAPRGFVRQPLAS